MDRNKIIEAIKKCGLHECLKINGLDLTIYYKSFADSILLFFGNQEIANKTCSDTLKKMIDFLIRHSSIAEICRNRNIIIDGYDLDLSEKIYRIICGYD